MIVMGFEGSANKLGVGIVKEDGSILANIRHTYLYISPCYLFMNNRNEEERREREKRREQSRVRRAESREQRAESREQRAESREVIFDCLQIYYPSRDWFLTKGDRTTSSATYLLLSSPFLLFFVSSCISSFIFSFLFLDYVPFLLLHI